MAKSKTNKPIVTNCAEIEILITKIAKELMDREVEPRLSALVSDYKMSKKYVYTVEYQHGKYGWSDYTDTITYNQNNSISYTDENGRKVTRYGTYSIIKNK